MLKTNLKGNKILNIFKRLSKARIFIKIINTQF